MTTLDPALERALEARLSRCLNTSRRMWLELINLMNAKDRLYRVVGGRIRQIDPEKIERLEFVLGTLGRRLSRLEDEAAALIAQLGERPLRRGRNFNRRIT